jgi:hypothetical protein
LLFPFPSSHDSMPLSIASFRIEGRQQLIGQCGSGSQICISHWVMRSSEPPHQQTFHRGHTAVSEFIST